MKLRVVAATVAVFACAPAGALASAWPLAGGDASRSGSEAAGAALPATPMWSVAGAAVRTPIVVTSAAAPDAQRVAYGTADGRVHVRALLTGAAVGPVDGVPATNDALTDPGSAFGPDGVAAAPAAAADELYVVHDDGGGIEVLRVDVTTGTRIGTADVPVPGSLGCTVAGSPLLTPPAADGSRFLYFTIRGACTSGAGLLRWGISGAGALLGAPSVAALSGVTRGASPSLVVLRDRSGAPRFYVAAPHSGGLALFDAARDLTASPDATAVLPAGELPQTPSAPATADGLVAGAAGAGTPPAGALYVAADAGGATRVHRFVQDGDGTTLREAAVVKLDGAPATGLAVAETMTPSGPSADGRLLVPTTSGVAVLRSADLSRVVVSGGTGAAGGAPVAAGSLGLVGRAGQDLLAVDLRGGATDTVPGTAAVQLQPALARGVLVTGSAAGVRALRTTDTTPPAVTLRGLPRSLRRGRRVTLPAGVADDRGVGSVVFRLGGRWLGRAAAPAAFAAAADLSARVRIPARLKPRRYSLTATATDASGLRRTVRRTVRVTR